MSVMATVYLVMLLLLSVLVSLVVTELSFPHCRQADTERLEGAVGASLLPPPSSSTDHPGPRHHQDTNTGSLSDAENPPGEEVREKLLFVVCCLLFVLFLIVERAGV